MDFEALRTELHRTVDEIIDRHLDRTPSSGRNPAESVSATGETKTEWSYRWPGGGVENFHRAQWYEVAGDRGRHRVLVAWAQRSAWGKEDRLRAIVFLQQGQATSTTYYPLTEFVETDDDRFAATIPRPSRPRAQLRTEDPRPDRFSGHVVERADALFESIAQSSSVRLVLEEGDEEEMVRHGYWVASLRNRF
ncbi:hypothetical protein [Kitasatospora herbaricolor]|uniref:Uncharacterized protein n=1 Tax=Kitasatospora herbaricolor TaxID=68217 RepID=A0ABZ1WK81_9ACTN|nr:hypothetical protein [Kitasatospora herbaricolor]